MNLRQLSTILTISCCIMVLTAGISIKNRKLIDDEGREIRFHGTNVVVKVPPYIPIIDYFQPNFSFSKEDMENCTKWGFNGIRLGMMWAGVEPTNEGYNQTYLDQMERLINMAGQHGIYSLIDFHQDLIAQKFCGDGVPTWLMDQLNLYKTFPFPTQKKIKLNQTGLPDWKDCNTDQWGKYYFSYDVGQTFRELYKTGTKLNKKFTDFWVKIASRFRGNKYVIGYELINEPFVGNAIRDLPLLFPSVAEKVHFQEFYDQLAWKIRSVDPDTIIFFEPITFDNNFPVGFTHPPGGFINQNKSVLAYHYYHPPALNLKTIYERIKDGERLGVPAFLSEFGSHDPEILNIAQQNQQSWLYWQFKNFGKNWGSSNSYFSLTSNKQLQNYSQNGVDENRTMTYLQRIAGQLKSQNHNFQTKYYNAAYYATPGGKSILYYSPDFNFKNGYQIEVLPSSQMSVKEISRGYLEITYTGSSHRLVQVSLTPL